MSQLQSHQIGGVYKSNNRSVSSMMAPLTMDNIGVSDSVDDLCALSNLDEIAMTAYLKAKFEQGSYFVSEVTFFLGRQNY